MDDYRDGGKRPLPGIGSTARPCYGARIGFLGVAVVQAERRTVTPPARRDPRGDLVVAYLRTLVEGLVPTGRERELRYVHEAGAANDYVWWVYAPPELVGMIVGGGGQTAEAIRRLLRCHCGLMTWDVRPDVRIRGNNETIPAHAISQRA